MSAKLSTLGTGSRLILPVSTRSLSDMVVDNVNVLAFIRYGDCLLDQLTRRCQCLVHKECQCGVLPVRSATIP